MQVSANEPPRRGGAHHKGVHPDPVRAQRFEIGEDERAGYAAAECRQKEIGRNRQKAGFAAQIAEACLQVGGEPAEAEGLRPALRCVGLPGADLRFHHGGDEKAGRVEQEQRRKPDGLIADAGDGNHDDVGQRVDQAGHRVGALEVAAADERRVKALVGDGVYAVDAADEDGHQQEHRISDKVKAQQKIKGQKNAAGKKVQRADDALSRKPVQIGAGQQRQENAGQTVAHHEEGVE